jgi:histidyl-tRNA synthetase
MYQYGKDVPRDFVKAKELYEQAITSGNSDAMNNLGYMYQDGGLKISNSSIPPVPQEPSLASAQKGAGKKNPKQTPSTKQHDSVDKAPTAGKAAKKTHSWRDLKTPKGTRDYNPEQMMIRERVFAIMTEVFKRHGAVTIDTPVFELKETLMNKYGEDSKLIYDLQDQGGELCSLRYDLTVPFARYLAMNRKESMKRYHIARVYRRDQPAVTKGRFREFYQCDFDIAGTYDPMLPDAECVKMMVEILTELKIGTFVIKINHRKLLDAIFEVCGVPLDDFRTICSSVDKLDKETWDEVEKEMTEGKRLPAAVAAKIKLFVQTRGAPAAVLASLQTLIGGVPTVGAPTNPASFFSSAPLRGNTRAAEALADLSLLVDYLKMLNVEDFVVFDLSLARGLDYYTGVIYEAILSPSPTDIQPTVGSIAGGGRYDTLIGIFGSKAIPSVGFSIGVERVFAILEDEAVRKKTLIPHSSSMVYVASLGNDPSLLALRFSVCNRLWAAGVRAELGYKAAPNLKWQLNQANNAGIPLCLILTAEDAAAGNAQLKDLVSSVQTPIALGDGLPDAIRAAYVQALQERDAKSVKLI